MTKKLPLSGSFFLRKFVFIWFLLFERVGATLAVARPKIAKLFSDIP